MRLGIDVDIHGVTTHVETRPSDIVAWERETGKSVGDWATTTPGYSDIAWLAWHAIHRGDKNPTPFLDWLDDGVEAITAREDKADTDPTRKAQ